MEQGTRCMFFLPFLLCFFPPRVNGPPNPVLPSLSLSSFIVASLVFRGHLFRPHKSPSMLVGLPDASAPGSR